MNEFVSDETTKIYSCFLLLGTNVEVRQFLGKTGRPRCSFEMGSEGEIIN